MVNLILKCIFGTGVAISTDGGVFVGDKRGWLTKTNPRQQRHLHNIALRNRSIAVLELNDTFRVVTGIRLSKSTIHNKLRGVNLHCIS